MLFTSSLFSAATNVANSTQVANTTSSAAQVAPAVTTTAHTAAPTTATGTKKDAPKKNANHKSTYVAPKDAVEAKQRIEARVNAKSITANQVDDVVVFTGNTYSLRNEFRLLGGQYDNNEWSVPTSYYLNPSSAVPTKSEKAIKHEAAIAALPEASIAKIKHNLEKQLGSFFNAAFVKRLIDKVFEGID